MHAAYVRSCPKLVSMARTNACILTLDSARPFVRSRFSSVTCKDDSSPITERNWWRNRKRSATDVVARSYSASFASESCNQAELGSRRTMELVDEPSRSSANSIVSNGGHSWFHIIVILAASPSSVSVVPSVSNSLTSPPCATFLARISHNLIVM